MSWQDVAACRGMDPDLFFPVSRHEVPPAVVLACKGCPVADECLADGLAEPHQHGIRAGLTAPERQAMLKGRRRAVHDRMVSR